MVRRVQAARTPLVKCHIPRLLGFNPFLFHCSYLTITSRPSSATNPKIKNAEVGKQFIGKAAGIQLPHACLQGANKELWVFIGSYREGAEVAGVGRGREQAESSHHTLTVVCLVMNSVQTSRAAAAAAAGV